MHFLFPAYSIEFYNIVGCLLLKNWANMVDIEGILGRQFQSPNARGQINSIGSPLPQSKIRINPHEKLNAAWCFVLGRFLILISNFFSFKRRDI